MEIKVYLDGPGKFPFIALSISDYHYGFGEAVLVGRHDSEALDHIINDYKRLQESGLFSVEERARGMITVTKKEVHTDCEFCNPGNFVAWILLHYNPSKHR